MSSAARARRGGRLRKYGAVAAASFRRELVESHAWLGRMGFYGVILLIFSRLWQVVFAEHAVAGHDPVEFVWYLALTEWVVLSMPPVFLDIEADVRNGDIVHRLSRPMSYLGARLAEAGGALALRLVTMAFAGLLLARVLSGGVPDAGARLLWALPLGVLASVVQLLFVAGVGLSALWIHDSSPVYWVWQKAGFLLGGLLLPLEIYPDWLRELAYCTPFAPLLHGVGRVALQGDAGTALRVGGLLALWGLVAALGLAWLYRRGLRALDVGGG
jgi:viologen exporter family transport system permease protein